MNCTRLVQIKAANVLNNIIRYSTIHLFTLARALLLIYAQNYFKMKSDRFYISNINSFITNHEIL